MFLHVCLVPVTALHLEAELVSVVLCWGLAFGPWTAGLEFVLFPFYSCIFLGGFCFCLKLGLCYYC